MSTCVLIDEGGHGGRCWRAVAKRLKELGQCTHTPTQTGLTARAHLIDAVAGLLQTRT